MMSNQRFKISDCDLCFIENIPLIWDSQFHYHMNQKDVAETLNKFYFKINSYEEELLENKEYISMVVPSMLNLKKENEQLKLKLDKIREQIKEADIFSDRATEHDTIAYREMNEFDNKDAYSIAYAIQIIKEVINNE